MVDRILEGLAAGKRAILASTITLVETEHPGKKRVAQRVLDRILQSAAHDQRKTYRIGIYDAARKLDFELITSFIS